jgi:arylsulfatase A-like enzyme
MARNFLMISIDDMRTINNWGHFTPLIETPNIDRLAGR